MRARIAKRILSLLLALVTALSLLPAAALAADEQQDIDVPPLDNAVYDENIYSLRVVNLDKGLVNIDARMHVGFPGYDVSSPVFNPAYTNPDYWQLRKFPHWPAKEYDLGMGYVTRMESTPFAISTKQKEGKDTVPVAAMVDGVNADRLLNLQEEFFDFKRWANNLIDRDYDPDYPQKGAMVAPSEFKENYVHSYKNYPPDPVDVLVYRDNVAPMDESAEPARTMSLVVGAVPYEENALVLEVTGTESVPIAPDTGEKDLSDNPIYRYDGDALVTVKVTNTASYPVLAQITASGANFIEIDGKPDPENTVDGNGRQTLTDDWNPGNKGDEVQAQVQGNFFYIPKYLVAGQTAVGTIRLNSKPKAGEIGQAFTKDAVTKMEITVENVTNHLGSEGILDTDKTITAVHNTFWQGSGVENLGYIPVPFDNDPSYEVSPSSIDIWDIYNNRFVENPWSWNDSKCVHTPNQITFRGPYLDRVTRILAVVKLRDGLEPFAPRTRLYATSDNLTPGKTNEEKNRQPARAHASREVVLTFTPDGDKSGSLYSMVAFKEDDGSAYTEEEITALKEQPMSTVGTLFRTFYPQETLPFTYKSEEITLELPKKYFDQDTEEMHYSLWKDAMAGSGIPEKIDFYLLRENDKHIVPTTAKLPHWMLGDQRPAVFQGISEGFDSISLYNFRLTPEDPDYETAHFERPPDASVTFENSRDTRYTTAFGNAFYLYQDKSSNEIRAYNAPQGDKTPLVSFTGRGDLQVVKASGGKAVSGMYGRGYDYFIPAGTMLNHNMLLRSNPYALAGGSETGIYVKQNGASWEVWSEGCDVLVNGKPVLQDIQILLNGSTKYSSKYGEAGVDRYQKIPVLPFVWSGRENTADSVPIVEGGFLNGDIYGGYLYQDSIGLDIEITDPTFLPLDIENIVGLGEVGLRAEVRLPADAEGTSLWEIKTNEPSEFQLGGDYALFSANASLAFEADTFRETPKEDRFINVSGEANLLDMLRIGVICNYKLVGDDYVFDKVYLSGGSDLIGLPPVMPVLQLKDVGGGIDGLADTLAHNKWDYIPPLTVNMDASVALTVKVIDLSADKAGVVLGLSKMGIYADALALKAQVGSTEDDNISMDFLRNLEMSTSWDLKKDKSGFGLDLPLPVYEFYTQGGVEFLDCLSGTASLLIVVDTAELVNAIYQTMNQEGKLDAWAAKYDETKVFDMQGLIEAYGDTTTTLLNNLLISNQVFSVEGKAWGSVNIPGYVPFVGGHELLNGEVGMSYYAPELTLSASGKYDVFVHQGVAGVTFTYNMESGNHDVGLMSALPTAQDGENYTVTLEGVNYRAVPVVAVPVEPQAAPLAETEPTTRTEPPAETELPAGSELPAETDPTTDTESTKETDPATENEPTAQIASAAKTIPTAKTAPAAAAGPDDDVSLAAVVDGFQITSQPGDDVVFVEFLATEPVGITIASQSESTLKHTIEADPAEWVKVWEKGKAQTADPDYYRYTFVFSNDGIFGGQTCSIHGTGEKTGGYVWTASVTDQADEAKLTACNVATIDPPEALSTAAFDGETVTFTAQNLEEGKTYTAGLSLVPVTDFDLQGNPTSEGIGLSILENGVTQGQNTLTLPDNYEELVQSGGYRAVVSLHRADREQTTRLGTSAVTAEFQVVNPNAPDAIGEITYLSIGNGALEFTIPAPTDGKTTGYEMKAVNGNDTSILVPKLDKDGNPVHKLGEDGQPTEEIVMVDAFAAPVTYTMDKIDHGKLTIAADGSRLKAGQTYDLTFTPYYKEAGASTPFYGPSKTITVTFPAPAPAVASVTVAAGKWKDVTPAAQAAETRYLAQEELITTPTGTGSVAEQLENVGKPVETGITFTTNKAVASWEITAVGGSFAETDNDGKVTNNMTKVFCSDAGADPAPLNKPFTLPLSVGEHQFTVRTVDENGDANVQVFRFTVNGLGVAFSIDGVSFDPGTSLGNSSGQTFTFTALLDETGQITKVGNQLDPLTPQNGTVIWSKDPQVTPQVLAKEGDKTVAWRYVVPVEVEDTATGAKATRSFSFDFFDKTSDAYFPSRLELSVDPGVKLNTSVTGATVSVSAVTDAGTVPLDSSEVEFKSSNEAVLTVASNGAITIKKVGTASITAAYKGTKKIMVEGQEKTFQPKASLSVTVSGSEAAVPTPLQVSEVTHESVTLQLGALNVPSVTLKKSAGGAPFEEVETLTTGFDSSQTVTVIGLDPATDYQFRAVPKGGYYAPATIRATTYTAPVANAKYSVVYAQDGADGGTAPVDPNLYPENATVSLMTSQTPLTRNGVEVLGFSTEPNGGGTRLLYADVTDSYTPNFTMGSANATLYPIWPAGSSTGSSPGGTSKQPTFPGGKGWSDVGKTLDSMTEGETLAIDMNGVEKLPAEVLEAMAGKDVTLELDMGGGASWIIQGTDVPEGLDLADLKLGVDPEAKTIPVEVIDAATGAQAVLQVELAHNGPFAVHLTLRLTVGKDQAGRWANLYYYDPAKKTLEFRASARVDDKGRTDLPLDHASSYAVILDSAPHAPWANPFTDVAEGDWFYDAVQYVHQNGLFAGTSETAFSPGVPMSRAMLWTVLARFDGQDTAGGDTWYEQGRTWAMDRGISDGTDPEGPVTREQVATMLFRYAGSKALDVSARADLNRFSDAPAVFPWAKDALAWATAAGILTGKPGPLLDPQGQATRAEVAALLQRFLLLNQT